MNKINTQILTIIKNKGNRKEKERQRLREQ